MTVADERYDEGYWLRAEGSNYVGYGDDPGWRSTAILLADLLHPEPGTRLLEVGCSMGWFLKHAVQHGFDAVGMDPSPYAIEHPAPGMEDRIVMGNAQSTVMGDDFDVVCSWEVLEHIEEAEIPRSLENMWNALRPGGLFVHRICLPGLEDDDHTHVTVVPREWWLDVIDTLLPGARHLEYVEKMFDQQFAYRDWAGRFFAYRKGRA